LPVPAGIAISPAMNDVASGLVMVVVDDDRRVVHVVS
jgi:hypothetical protein